MQQVRAVGAVVVLTMLAVTCERMAFVCGVVCMPTSAAAAPAAPPTPAMVRIGLPTGKTSFANIDVVVAQELGLFKQQALDVSIQNFDSGVKVVQAVVANDVAIGGASIEPVVNASVAGGNVAIIGTYANRLTVSMVTPKTIASAADLRGKSAGIQDVGAFREG
jgi:ABC-type nitrate/sulfonate/bicarbonate transport system substrate-binding protein